MGVPAMRAWLFLLLLTAALALPRDAVATTLSAPVARHWTLATFH